LTTIHPVIMAVPDQYRQLTGRQKTTALSGFARKALAASARKSGVILKELEQDDRGAPIPKDGCHWSISHKDRYVAGVVAPGPIGIDIERVRPYDRAMRKKIAGQAEWQLGAADSIKFFFRVWTAKEAVLKATGAGLRELSDCRIAQIIDTHRVGVVHRDLEWIVFQHEFDGHLSAVVTNGWEVKWDVTSC